jgi:hypothetical protein
VNKVCLCTLLCQFAVFTIPVTRTCTPTTLPLCARDRWMCHVEAVVCRSVVWPLESSTLREYFQCIQWEQGRVLSSPLLLCSAAMHGWSTRRCVPMPAGSCVSRNNPESPSTFLMHLFLILF